MKGNPQPCANTISAAIQGARIHPASERRFQLLTAIGKGEMFNTPCERRHFLIQNRYWAHRCHHLHAHLAVWFPWWVSYFQISSLPSPLPFSCPQLLNPAPATTVTLNCAPNASPGSTEWKDQARNLLRRQVTGRLRRLEDEWLWLEKTAKADASAPVCCCCACPLQHAPIQRTNGRIKFSSIKRRKGFQTMQLRTLCKMSFNAVVLWPSEWIKQIAFTPTRGMRLD